MRFALRQSPSQWQRLRLRARVIRRSWGMSKTFTARRGGRLTLLIGLLVLAMTLYVARAEAISAGQSVVGTGLLPSAPNLIINTSGGNDVVYIQPFQRPVAYGGNVQGPPVM